MTLPSATTPGLTYWRCDVCRVRFALTQKQLDKAPIASMIVANARDDAELYDAWWLFTDDVLGRFETAVEAHEAEHMTVTG